MNRNQHWSSMIDNLHNLRRRSGISTGVRSRPGSAVLTLISTCIVEFRHVGYFKILIAIIKSFRHLKLLTQSGTARHLPECFQYDHRWLFIFDGSESSRAAYFLTTFIPHTVKSPDRFAAALLRCGIFAQVRFYRMTSSCEGKLTDPFCKYRIDFILPCTSIQSKIIRAVNHELLSSFYSERRGTAYFLTTIIRHCVDDIHRIPHTQIRCNEILQTGFFRITSAAVMTESIQPFSESSVNLLLTCKTRITLFHGH